MKLTLTDRRRIAAEDLNGPPTELRPLECQPLAPSQKGIMWLINLIGYVGQCQGSVAQHRFSDCVVWSSDKDNNNNNNNKDQSFTFLGVTIDNSC